MVCELNWIKKCIGLFSRMATWLYTLGRSFLISHYIFHCLAFPSFLKFAPLLSVKWYVIVVLISVSLNSNGWGQMLCLLVFWISYILNCVVKFCLYYSCVSLPPTLFSPDFVIWEAVFYILSLIPSGFYSFRYVWWEKFQGYLLGISFLLLSPHYPPFMRWQSFP